jgi:hypothetical protein
VRRKGRRRDPFPPELCEFREEEWPPAPGECLGIYACRDAGYALDCVSLEGECGWRTYARLAVEDPEAIPRWKRADAFERFKAARLAWLGEDHPLYLDEFLDGFHKFEGIRYGKYRKER